MKTNILNILAAGALLVGTTACDDWNPVINGGEGTVDLAALSIESDDAQKMVTSHSAASKAVGDDATADDVDFSNYIVTVTSKEGTSAPQTWAYKDVPEVLTLTAGEYTLSVESHQVEKAAWEAPYYKGSQDFTVTAGKITNIGTVTAAFSSIRVSVTFSKDLAEALGDDAKVTIEVNDEGLLEFTPGETRSGYFKHLEGSFTMVAHFTGTVDGAYTEHHQPFADVAAGQHRMVTYSLKGAPTPPEATGSIDPTTGISLDVDVIDVPIDENVTTEEDVINPGHQRPTEDPDEQGGIDPEDPTPDDPVAGEINFAASAGSTSLDLAGETNAVGYTGDAIVEISVTKGIANLIVTISSDNPDFTDTLPDMGMDKPFDLAYPSDDIKANCDDLLHFPYGDAVIGKTFVEFNITDFMPLLPTFPGHHTFLIEVKDLDGNSKTLTLKINS